MRRSHFGSSSGLKDKVLTFLKPTAGYRENMDGHSVSMAVSYVEFLSSLFGTPLSSAGRARSYSDETPQASYAPCSPVHWVGISDSECGQGHFEHSREDKETAFLPASTVKIPRSTSD
mmetsp:Transcript_6717/g.7587  ORF Transcript_6717/g.7587 Transcript_6717/m.7587 type:complete len:118 (-) Transcript_6717:56-409(-)